ncbi:TfuA-like protein [Hoeflea sp. EC-HK425]|uniref:TfuA-like protein n=1 Tax=Hoeflea sp. EC-HK425 TaxID=2038388 RepID=UPI001252B0C7|nr:TfuA-like protein [Hoeflea sp. EC-HK425]VVT28234.1 putative TfuA domain-containing protein [Hoeflea sp. EC-HK425]|tara:strand:- start:1421 stop:2146 length:726 start_codon:yes stop_codon:yes gene_type:complete
MKVLFAGPSLHGSTKTVDPSITLLPPAAQGDIAAAVHRGVNVIGLIDGVYESIAAIWHKEILFALSEGVQVIGGASLGALRAAECTAFGMIGVGEIFRDYQTGNLIDDADVALLHAPKELGYRPLTEAMVDVRATISWHVQQNNLSREDGCHLLQTAENQFFKDRTWRTIITGAGFPKDRGAELHTLICRKPMRQKQMDAELVLEHVTMVAARRASPPTDWTLRQTSLFRPWRGAQESLQG